MHEWYSVLLSGLAVLVGLMLLLLLLYEYSYTH